MFKSFYPRNLYILKWLYIFLKRLYKNKDENNFAYLVTPNLIIQTLFLSTNLFTFLVFPISSGGEWGDPKAKDCYGQTQPLDGSTYPGGIHPGEAIVKSVTSNTTKKVYLLDITLLTQLRKDGHPSVYAGGGPSLLDCSHWCLAGVPDTWNQLLYASLLPE